MKKLLYSLVVGFAFTVLQLSTVSAQTGGMPPGMPNDGPPGMPGGPGDMNDGLGGFVPPPMPPEMEKCNMMPPGPDQVRCFDELPCDLVGPPPGIPLGEHQKVVDQCEEYQRSKGITPSSTGGMPPMDMNSGMPNDGPGMTGGPGGMPGMHGGPGGMPNDGPGMAPPLDCPPGSGNPLCAGPQGSAPNPGMAPPLDCPPGSGNPLCAGPQGSAPNPGMSGMPNDGPGMTGGPGGMPGMHGGPGGMPNDGPGMTGGPGGMPNDGSFDPADHQRQLKKCEMMPPGPDQGRCFEAVPPPPMPPEMEKCNMMPPGPDQGRCFDELPCDLGGPPPEVVSECEMRKAGMHNDGPPGMTGGPSGMPGGQDGNPRP
jgi:hypothetical protein